jgi:hypothetical protein
MQQAAPYIANASFEWATRAANGKSGKEVELQPPKQKSRIEVFVVV